MNRLLTGLVLCAILGAGVAWGLTRPAPLQPDFGTTLTADAERGKLVFDAGGCASCHAAPDSEDKTVLAGGEAFASAFGTFYAPNISPSAEGIGGWGLPAFARAMTEGVSPEGKHYYPAFPYVAYAGMTAQDVADLHAYMQTLPPSATESKPHEVSFPFNIRRALGAWKLLYGNRAYVLTGDLSPEIERGRYLVETLGHCGECHTPRGPLGGLQMDHWLAGAPNPSGKGKIPNITPGGLNWSQSDLITYFTSGFTPDYDTVGGSMTAVVANLSQLPESDRAAIAAYLKAVPARD